MKPFPMPILGLVALVALVSVAFAQQQRQPTERGEIRRPPFNISAPVPKLRQGVPPPAVGQSKSRDVEQPSPRILRPPVPVSVQETAISREKRLDPAIVIVVWSEQDRTMADKLAQFLAPVVDSIATGGKLTQADAARTRAADQVQKFCDWLRPVMLTSRQSNRLRVLVLTQGGSGSPVQRKTAKCATCGSTQHEYCFPFLDYDKTVIEDYPIEDPQLTCVRIKGECYPPGCCGNTGSATGGPQGGGGRLINRNRTVIVFVVGGTPTSYQQERQALVRAVTDGVEEVLTSASRLVIKTKSTPR